MFGAEFGLTLHYYAMMLLIPLAMLGEACEGTISTSFCQLHSGRKSASVLLEAMLGQVVANVLCRTGHFAKFWARQPSAVCPCLRPTNS